MPIQTDNWMALCDKVTDTLHMKFGVFDKLQRGMMGVGVGIGLATLLTVVFPPAAAIMPS